MCTHTHIDSAFHRSRSQYGTRLGHDFAFSACVCVRARQIGFVLRTACSSLASCTRNSNREINLYTQICTRALHSRLLMLIFVVLSYILFFSIRHFRNSAWASGRVLYLYMPMFFMCSVLCVAMTFEQNHKIEFYAYIK